MKFGDILKNYLGYEVIDNVTKFKGTVTTVSFDLYGCTQAFVNPPINEKSEIQDGYWFDLNRLKIMSATPVMISPHVKTDEESLNGFFNNGPAFKTAPKK